MDGRNRYKYRYVSMYWDGYGYVCLYGYGYWYGEGKTMDVVMLWLIQPRERMDVLTQWSST